MGREAETERTEGTIPLLSRAFSLVVGVFIPKRDSYLRSLDGPRDPLKLYAKYGFTSIFPELSLGSQRVEENRNHSEGEWEHHTLIQRCLGLLTAAAWRGGALFGRRSLPPSEAPLGCAQGELGTMEESQAHFSPTTSRFCPQKDPASSPTSVTSSESQTVDC